MKILLVSFQNGNDAAHGSSKGAVKNATAMRQFGEVEIYCVERRSWVGSFFSMLQGRMPPVRIQDERVIIQKILNHKIDVVFLDSSLLGSIAKRIKTEHPDTYVITSYRNCEYDYIHVRFNKNQAFKRFIYRSLALKAEKAATIYANKRLVLTDRDKRRIESLYDTKVDCVIPQSMDDKYDANYICSKVNADKRVLLFGPSGSANLEAFLWFVNNVSPFINAKTVIAGNGMENYNSLFERPYVDVVGFAENLNELYATVDCVAIPLLRGGGMKFKTAEAMMFGKYIVGTSEAFVGYDADMSGFSWKCDDAKVFITAIKNCLSKNSRFCIASRKCYLNNYTHQACQNKYRHIMPMKRLEY